MFEVSKTHHALPMKKRIEASGESTALLPKIHDPNEMFLLGWVMDLVDWLITGL